MSISGLIAAAGRSARMGRPKALLPFEDTTFLGQLVQVFKDAGLDDIWVTLPEGPDQTAVREAAVAAGARALPNGWPDLQLGGSVRTVVKGLAGDVDGLLLTPVDVPFASVDLVRALKEELGYGATAIVPIVDGQQAHPVGFGRRTFVALDRAADARGPRTVLDALGDDVMEHPADDPRLLANLNTPADYEALFGCSP
jgi:molybdenum cofactor cytidylyltransferase